MPAWLGWIAVVLLSLYLAVYPAIAAGLAWRWHNGSRLVLVLLLAAAWIVTEWLRGTLFTGFAWNPVGVTLSADRGILVGRVDRHLRPFRNRGAARQRDLARLRSIGAEESVRDPSRSHHPALRRRLAGATGADGRTGRPGPHRPAQYRPAEQVGPSATSRRISARFATLSGWPSATPRLLLWPEAATPDYLTIQPGARRRLAALIGPHDLLVARRRGARVRARRPCHRRL